MESKYPITERFTCDHINALSKQQIQSFFEDGYIIVKQLFTHPEIAKIKELVTTAFEEAKNIAIHHAIDHHINEITEFRCDYNSDNVHKAASILARFNEDKTISIKLISWIGGVRPELIGMSRQLKITIPVAQLLGSDIADHLINQIHYKMPNDHVTFDWHQDLQNRRTFDPQWQDVNRKGSFVQVLTALDENTPDNGPLVVIPKSHKKNLCLAQRSFNEKIDVITANGYNPSQFKPLLVKPGGHYLHASVTYP